MDAEGISGIYNFQQVLPEGLDFEHARKLMASDVNAAAKGAFDAGATEVFVNDAHNFGNNLLIMDLDKRIRLCSGGSRPLSMAQGIERGFDAALLIGYHSDRGSKGVIAHSFSYYSMVEMRLNDKIITEFELIGHVCGHFGTPVIFVSGDDQLVRHARAYVPDIYSTITKECVGDSSAICINPLVTSEMIYKNVKEAVSRINSDMIKPMRVEGEVKLDVRFHSETQAELAMGALGTYRICSHTVRFLADNYLESYKNFLTGVFLASTFKA
jgi:D-amino peptidase